MLTGGPIFVCVCAQGALETLQQEARILSRVRHPNIVKFYGGNISPPVVFIVEELMQGDLSALVHGNNELLHLDDVLRIGKDIAMGLFHLHPTIVHRDLKPANVLMDHRGAWTVYEYCAIRSCVRVWAVHALPRFRI